MKLPWRFLTVVVAVVAGSLLLAACGDGEEGEELGLDEYFRQLDEIEEGIKTDIGALGEESEGAWEDIEATRDYVDGYRDILEQGISDMRELDPPAEAEDAHDEFVAALSDMVPVSEDYSERLADIETPSELQELFAEQVADPRLQEAWQRVDDACVELQGIADENGINVSLDCE